MSSLMGKFNIKTQWNNIEEIDNSLIDLLKALPVIQFKIQGVPQIERGDPIPSEIAPTELVMPVESAIELSVKPQRLFSTSINLPKRYEGIIQLQANEREYNEIIALTEQAWEARTELQSNLKDIEPNSRKRAALTKRLFPGILFQTIRRKVPVVDYNAHSVISTWCEGQSSLKKIGGDEAAAWVDRINKHVPEFQAEKNLLRLESVKAVYKKTEIRVHPLSLVKALSKQGSSKGLDKLKVKTKTHKTHSPIIALTESNTQIPYTALPIYSPNENAVHKTLKGYKPLVEGSCLVYKVSN